MIYKSGLYIVSTPIGNLEDITLRALNILKNSDIILCEDTGVSRKLLAKYNIKAVLKVYNDHSDGALRKNIEDMILSGKIVSLISDAGTPLISDPGYKLVRDLKDNGISVDIIPGPCAAIAALTLSGLPTDKFIFMGFLPKTKEGRIKSFESISKLNYTIIFYETSKRLLPTLRTALEILGDRTINIARELTKLYQESKTASISDLIKHYTNVPPKGEIVFSISGEYAEKITIDDLNLQIGKLLKQNLSAKTVSDTVFMQYCDRFSRAEIYKAVNKIKDMGGI